MIGLSVSLCIKDVIEGKMSVNDVEKIIARTACRTAEDWDRVIEYYKHEFWRQAPEEAEKIIRQLIADGKVSQPRLTDHKIPDVMESMGLWVLAEEHVSYRPFFY